MERTGFYNQGIEGAETIDPSKITAGQKYDTGLVFIYPATNNVIDDVNADYIGWIIFNENVNRWQEARGGGDNFPIGGIVTWAGSLTNKPVNYWECNGGLFSRTAYPELFNALGTANGHGDGSTTANLIDGRGRVLKHLSGSSGRDFYVNSRVAAATGGNTGNNVGSIQDDSTRTPRYNSLTVSTAGEHTHSLKTEYGGGIDGGQVAPNGTYNQVSNSSNYINTVSIQSAGNHNHALTGWDLETNVKNVAIYYLIKAYNL